VLDFFTKLALVQVIKKSQAQKIMLLMLLVIVLNFLVLVCCAISGAPLRVLFFMLPTAPLLALFISFTFASSKLKNFLIRHLAEQMEPTSWSAHTIFQAVSVLSHFSNHFRFWLLAALFSFLGVYPSEQNPSVLVLIPHLIAIAAYRIYIQFGQVMMNFCLPAGASELVLMTPEKRLWAVITGMPLRNLPHYFGKVMQPLRNLPHCFVQVMQWGWARVVCCWKKPQRVAPGLPPTTVPSGPRRRHWNHAAAEENALESSNAPIHSSYLNCSEGYMVDRMCTHTPKGPSCIS